MIENVMTKPRTRVMWTAAERAECGGVLPAERSVARHAVFLVASAARGGERRRRCTGRGAAGCVDGAGAQDRRDRRS